MGQAMIAAQAVQSKLQEMQAAQKEEEKKKKEQKVAERIAQLEAAQADKSESPNPAVPKVATGRILEEVEKQETEMKDGEKKKRKREKDSPMLITLKPFYRPNEKKGQKKRRLDLSEVDDGDDYYEEEEFTPRSPVPLPENVNLRPVLKPYMTKSQDKKSVKYADGVLPGQGSPDQSVPATPSQAVTPVPVVTSTPATSSASSVAKMSKKKKYKKISITVITQHTGDTDSEDEPPPPPPPGSPPRYSYKELMIKYGQKQSVESTA